MLSLSAFHNLTGFTSLWWSVLPAQQGDRIVIMDTGKHTEYASCPLPTPAQTPDPPPPAATVKLAACSPGHKLRSYLSPRDEAIREFITFTPTALAVK